MTIATIRISKPRSRNNIGAFDSDAAASNPSPRTARIEVAIHIPRLSAKSRVHSCANAGFTMTMTPNAAIAAHKINANAIMLGCVLFSHARDLFGI